MKVRTIARAAAGIAAGTAALAAFVITAPGVPAQAAVRAPVASAAPAPLPDCYREMAAYALVSRQAGVTIGSTGLPWNLTTSPATWARELRAADDVQLARVAAAVRGPRSGDLLVLALTASAAADDQVIQGGNPAGVCDVRGS